MEKLMMEWRELEQLRILPEMKEVENALVA